MKDYKWPEEQQWGKYLYIRRGKYLYIRKDANITRSACFHTRQILRTPTLTVNEEEKEECIVSDSSSTHLVNRLKLLRHCKDGLDVVVTQFLNQVSNGGIVLWNGEGQLVQHCSHNKTAPSYLHNSGSLCRRYPPSDISHHWVGQCHPVCHHRQSGSQHQWRKPADGSRPSNQSGSKRSVRNTKHKDCESRYPSVIQPNTIIKMRTKIIILT